MVKHRCAIIGCGGRARMHALAYKLIDRGELVACCDLIAERRERLAGEFGLRAVRRRGGNDRAGKTRPRPRGHSAHGARRS